MFRRASSVCLCLVYSLLHCVGLCFCMLVVDAMGDHNGGSVLKYGSCYGFVCGEYRFFMFVPLGRITSSSPFRNRRIITHSSF